jgi:hypothetical protein
MHIPGVTEAEDLRGIGWGWTSCGSRGNTTELTTNRALDLTAACATPGSGVKRIVLQLGVCSHTGNRWIRLVYVLDTKYERVVLHFRAGQPQHSPVPLTSAAQSLGIPLPDLEAAVLALTQGILLAAAVA